MLLWHSYMILYHKPPHIVDSTSWLCCLFVVDIVCLRDCCFFLYQVASLGELSLANLPHCDTLSAGAPLTTTASALPEQPQPEPAAMPSKGKPSLCISTFTINDILRCIQQFSEHFAWNTLFCCCECNRFEVRQFTIKDKTPVDEYFFHFLFIFLPLPISNDLILFRRNKKWRGWEKYIGELSV